LPTTAKVVPIKATPRPLLLPRGSFIYYARRPKKLKEGRNKYNEPQTKEAEKALLTIKAAKERGEFQPRRDHDELTKALGNLEHHGRVRGVSSRQS